MIFRKLTNKQLCRRRMRRRLSRSSVALVPWDDPLLLHRVKQITMSYVFSHETLRVNKQKILPNPIPMLNWSKATIPMKQMYENYSRLLMLHFATPIFGVVVVSKKEIDYGKKIFDIAKELSVNHFVYSSLDYTEKLMAHPGGHQCWHYDAKAIVAEYIESHDPKGPTSWTIITTAPYFENFQSYFLPTKDHNDPDQLIFSFPMANKPIVLVALDDIAWFVNYSFENPDKAKGNNFYIASDNITMDKLVKIFTEGICHSSKTVQYTVHMIL